MANAALPPGFELDAPTAAPGAGALPPGFELDAAPAAAAAPASSAAPLPGMDDQIKAAVMRAPMTAASPIFGGALSALDAVTGGHASSAVENIVTSLGNSALDAIKLPGDVLMGKAGQPTFDPMTGQVNQFPDDMIARGTNAAGFMLGGEYPGAPGHVATLDGVPIPGKVIKAVGRDQVPLSEVGPRVAELGPAGKVADLGPNTQALAAGIATQPGEASTVITNSLRDRQRGASTRVPQAVNDVLGPATPPSEIQATIKANKQEISPLYTQALSSASPVDTTSVAQALDTQIPTLRGKAQTALEDVRGMLNVTGKQELDTSPTTLLQTRNAIDGMLAGEADGNVQRVLGAARAQIDGLLEEAVPGIKDVDAQYREQARQKDALEAGGQVLDGGKSAVWPQDNAAAVAAGVQPEGSLVGPSAATFRLSQGARADVERIVGTKANDRVALQGILQGDSDWNPQKLAQLFGQDKADAIMQVVNNERQMAETENKALAGSKTAATEAAKADVNTPEKMPSALRSAANFRFGDAAFNAADKLSLGRATKARDVTNRQIADIVMGSGDWRQLPGGPATKAPLPIPQRQKHDDDEIKAAVMRGLN